MKTLEACYLEGGSKTPFTVIYEPNDGGMAFHFEVHSFDIQRGELEAGYNTVDVPLAGEAIRVCQMTTLQYPYWRLIPDKKQVAAQGGCSCDIINLMQQGCQCGAIVRYGVST